VVNLCSSALIFKPQRTQWFHKEKISRKQIQITIHDLNNTYILQGCNLDIGCFCIDNHNVLSIRIVCAKGAIGRLAELALPPFLIVRAFMVFMED